MTVIMPVHTPSSRNVSIWTPTMGIVFVVLAGYIGSPRAGAGGATHIQGITTRVSLVAIHHYVVGACDCITVAGSLVVVGKSIIFIAGG